MPVYRANRRLINLVLDWANIKYKGKSEFMNDFIHDIEWYAAGKNREPDISSYDRSLYEKYNWYEALPPNLANSARSMARLIGTSFASPLMNAYRNKIVPRKEGSIIKIKDSDGEEVRIRYNNAKQTMGKFHLLDKDSKNEGRIC